MRIATLGFLGAAFLAGPMAANAQYVYYYEGADFDFFNSTPPSQPGNPYTATDQLTIWVTTSALLPANLISTNSLDFQGVGLVSLGDARQATDFVAIGGLSSAFTAAASASGRWIDAPEIDPASAASPLALLLSGLAVATAARRSVKASI